jgi:hypothetical protein
VAERTQALFLRPCRHHFTGLLKRHALNRLTEELKSPELPRPAELCLRRFTHRSGSPFQIVMTTMGHAAGDIGSPA